MLLELEDPRLRVSMRFTTENRVRLVMTFPCEESYRSRVMTALADLLRPAPVGAQAGCRRAGEEAE